MYGGEPILDLLNEPSFEFIKGDVRDSEDVAKATDGVYAVAHLAAIVGDPACAKQPELARAINLEGSKNLYRISNQEGAKKFIFASTCSNYGKMEDPDSFVTEDSKLAPVSLYAETKVATELFLLEQGSTNNCKATCLRFSTVYGLSLRPRFDLVVFGEQFWRPYCHVVDLARSVMSVIEAPAEKVSGEVFNVGDTSENYQKQMIVDEVLKQIPGGKIKFVKKNEDPRDYRVSFEKIKSQLGFKITKKVPDGISQIIKAVTDGFIDNPDDPKYRNVN
jgi:nucleoside-diphosphate-sugar epimerase